LCGSATSSSATMWNCPRDRASYRGIDRLPFVPSPLGAHPAWRAYFDADDSGALAGDLSTAQRIRDQLRAVDTSTEVIYARAFPLGTVPDVTASPEVADQQSRSLRRISERSAVVGPPDPVFVPIGFDVSIPLPYFHSALFQPGTIEGDHSLNGDTCSTTVTTRTGWLDSLQRPATAWGSSGLSRSSLLLQAEGLALPIRSSALCG
jgi:hypothetical protein